MNGENLSETDGCISKIVGTWRTLFSPLNIGHKIYPIDPSVPKDCEFVVIDSKIQIRVIHLCPNNVRKSQLLPQPVCIDINSSSKRNSLSEEYWFMKCNKMLKIGNCNCSFRRSLRHSIILHQTSARNLVKRTESLLTMDVPPTKINNVETFVERLIQDTFYEAFHEYYMIKSKDLGKVNPSYESTEDDVVVTLRKKVKPTGIRKSIRNSYEAFISKTNRNSTDSTKFNCSHKKVQKKSLVMLIHGIGASANIWAIVMNSLVSKGYEVIAPDMLGHGFSSAPTKAGYYTFSSLVLQALTIFDHYMVNSKRKCVLIGHSYGCSIITAMYPHRAHQISQLVLISGGGPTPLAAPVTTNEITPFGLTYTLLYPLIYCGLRRSFFYASRGKHFDVCDEENGLPNHVLDYISRGQKWPEGDAAFHRRILAPTLLVHGLQDHHVTLVQECEMERTIPRAFLELIPNAGHLAMIETPEHLIHMITCFLGMWS